MNILVIENYKKSFNNTLGRLRKIFGDFENFVLADSNPTYFEIKSHNLISISQNTFDSPFRFYANLFKKFPDAMIYRINKPNYPLNKLLFSEVNERYNENFDYVYSNAEECNLEGYFFERININAFKFLKKQNTKLLPNNAFNCSLMKNSVRHFISLDLRNFYYRDCFEMLFYSPKFISINLTPSCNYTCVKCQFHSSLLDKEKKIKFQKDFVDIFKFEELLERVGDFKLLQTIYPNITGEPLLHPQIVEIVKLTKKYGYNSGFTTNAFLLTKQLSDELVDAGIGPLAFSLDTLDKKKYNKIQAGGDLTTVSNNIKYFNKIFKEKNGFPGGCINVVLDESNKNEEQDLINMWNNEGMNVQISTYYNIFDNNRPFFNNDKWGPGDRKPCWALWQSLFLTHEGRIVSCGAMAKTLGLKDNIFDKPAKELWRCEALNKLRIQQLTGVKPGYCKEFTCWTGPMTTYAENENQMVIYAQASTQYFPKKETTLLKKISSKISNYLNQ